MDPLFVNPPDDTNVLFDYVGERKDRTYGVQNMCQKIF